MFAEELTKKRTEPVPEDTHVLNIRDQFYDLDSNHLNPFKNGSKPARIYAELNKDVTKALNKGETDASEKV